MLALAVYEQQCCSRCGFHESVRESDLLLTPERTVCKTCAGSEMYRRVLADEDKKADDQLKAEHGEHIPATVPRPSDGRHVHLQLLDPERAAVVRAAEADEEQRRNDRRARRIARESTDT